MDENLKSSPYQYICNYYEGMYPFIGKKVFSILSLVPVSLIMPKIPRKNKMIKNHISLLLLSPPGSAKSSISEAFEKITYNPLSTKKITPARLYYELKDKKMATLIVEDIANIFSDEILIKLIEGAIGEEGSISRDTMHNIKDEKMSKKIEVVSYFSGTPENVAERRIQAGLLQRTSPLIVFHTQQEHEKILDFIADNMGKNDFVKDENPIKEFYDDLYKIQEGSHSIFSPITGYVISKEINYEIKTFIKPLVSNMFNRFGITSARELESTYRFLCAHAFLNIYKREIIDHKIVITQEDLNVAKKLIKREIQTKYIILRCIEDIDYYNIKTRNNLREWEMNMRKHKIIVPKIKKFIMDGLIKN